jgi:hypothetical protein
MFCSNSHKLRAKGGVPVSILPLRALPTPSLELLMSSRVLDSEYYLCASPPDASVHASSHMPDPMQLKSQRSTHCVAHLERRGPSQLSSLISSYSHPSISCPSRSVCSPSSSSSLPSMLSGGHPPKGNSFLVLRVRAS